jgi:hypothetical protein
MVNKTLLPPCKTQPKHPTPSSIGIFSTGTGFAVGMANRSLGEPGGSLDPQPAWEGRARII